MHHAIMDQDCSGIFHKEMLYGGTDISSLVFLIESVEDPDCSNRLAEWNIQITNWAGLVPGVDVGLNPSNGIHAP